MIGGGGEKQKRASETCNMFSHIALDKNNENRINTFYSKTEYIKEIYMSTLRRTIGIIKT